MEKTLTELLKRYDLPATAFEELAEKVQDGWVFITSEEDLTCLSKRTGSHDVAMQFALGNMHAVRRAEIEGVTKKDTSEIVTLSLYFVEGCQYHLAQEQQQRKPHNYISVLN